MARDARSARSATSGSRAAALAGLVGALALARPAQADILRIYAEAHGGAVGGEGLSGDAVDADEDFFSNVPRGMYGLQVGARFLIFDGAIQHHQFANGSRLSTWTQLAAGVGIQADVGDERARKQRRGGFVEVAAHLVFGVGTGQQVDPPLSNDEITDKGFLVQGRLGFGKHLGRVLDVGLAVPMSWGYFLKNGLDDVANDVGTHYRSFQIEGLVYLRASLKLL
jgi:hypothetical protein